ncbi:MAG: electron transport complex subunit E [Oscillospiraceae bacterium]|jgi:electron transport complex protein RnfE|nr:electron transport complex subunit E [Oscillospiraceae bacterium]
MAEKRPSAFSVIKNGILTENPVFRLVLGVCPVLATTTSAINGAGMGMAATFVLIGSNVVISLLRKFIPGKVRIPAFVLVICTFVTLVQMLMQAFLPSLYESLGIFIPLIVVNCIILGRAEAFASKNPVVASAADGLGMGLGFTLALVLLGSVREIIGNGSIFGVNLLGAAYEPMLLMVLAPGAFIAFGLLLGIINALTAKRAKAKGGAKA